MTATYNLMLQDQNSITATETQMLISMATLDQSGSVSGRRDRTTVASPVDVDELTGFGEQLIRVSTKVVSLYLDEISWQAA